MTTMQIAATSLKIPTALKRRIARLAARSGESPHALMVRALAEHVEAAELHAAFVADAAVAEQQMRASGEAYAMADVHRYVQARAAGRKATRPRAVRWPK